VQKGLTLIVRASGAKTFWVRYYVNGKEYKKCIGAFEKITIENARKITLDYTNNAAKGINLLDADARVRADPPLESFAITTLQGISTNTRSLLDMKMKIYEDISINYITNVLLKLQTNWLMTYTPKPKKKVLQPRRTRCYRLSRQSTILPSKQIIIQVKTQP
jgi:hypothetical protein